MIKARFIISEDSGEFTVKGHSGSGDAGEDIVCAAVSSAAYMAANTVTEILGVKADTQLSDGYMRFSFGGSSSAADIIKGLRLHLLQLQEQYPDNVKVITEV